MKILICFVFLATILLSLISCGEHREGRETLHNEIAEEQKMTTSTVYESEDRPPLIPTVHSWKPYKGSVPEADLQELEILTTQERNGEILFLGNYYEELIIPDNKYELPDKSGWRVDLDQLSVVGKTETNDLVLAQELPSPTLLCTIDASSEITLYFRKDFAQGSLDGIDLSEFDIVHDGKIIEDRTFVEQVWENHVQKPADLIGYLSTGVDDNIRYYSFTLVHKEEAAMQYELNFSVCDGTLRIENPYVELYHEIPLSDLMGNETEP